MLLVVHQAVFGVSQSPFVSSFILVEAGKARQFSSYDALQRRHEGHLGPSQGGLLDALSTFSDCVEQASSPQDAGPVTEYEASCCNDLLDISRRSLVVGVVQQRMHFEAEHRLSVCIVAISFAGPTSGKETEEETASPGPPTADAAGDSVEKAEGETMKAWKIDVSPATAPEATRTGRVAWRVWRLYMRSAGLPLVLLLLLACAVRPTANHVEAILKGNEPQQHIPRARPSLSFAPTCAQASTYCTTLCDYWLRRWTSRGSPPLPRVHAWVAHYSGYDEAAEDFFYLMGYWALALLSVVSSVVTTVAFVRCGVNASSVLQANMLAALLR